MESWNPGGPLPAVGGGRPPSVPAAAPPGPLTKLLPVLLPVLLALAVVAAACSPADDQGGDGAGQARSSGDADPDGSGSSVAGSAEPEVELELEGIELDLRPGPFQVTIDRKPDRIGPGAMVEALDFEGNLLAAAPFAENGTALLRQLPVGPIDVQIADPGGTRYRAQPVSVPGEAEPDPPSYGQTELAAGFNYIPTRDGTTLSANVTLPGTVAGGPYPTLVEYSGYSPSDPGAGEDPYRLLIPALGYALVQVNVRGTGCSGGSFDAFERIQSLDGYDVIETVAAQPWSAGVGMFGVSYPGIMQLHVASTRPPSLAAIAPLSVTDGVDSVLYPGGIYNDGFGEEWTRQVGDRAAAGGQGWARARVEAGDETCAANQLLRVHNPDLVELVKANPFVTELTLERSARTHAAAIEVPTFIAGAWQDEQTGGRFPALLDELANAPVLRAVLYNGLHVDAVSGEVLARLIEFLEVFVAERSPTIDPLTRLLVGLGLSALFGETLTVPSGRYEGLPVDEAREAFEAGPSIEVLFEQGADDPNLPVPGFRAGFEQWPPRATSADTLFIDGASNGAAGGALLTDVAPVEESSWSFTTEPDEGQVTTIEELGRIWTNRPGWSWPEPDPDHSTVATTAPLDDDLVLVGHLSADLWVSVGGADDAAVEVTVSEVAPDGSETYVQSGWLQLSQRALADEATELRPVGTGLEADRQPLEPGGPPVLARVEVLPFAHVFRAGSRLRITIDTPGASRPQWRFAVDPQPVEVTIHSTPDQPSRIVLPVIPDLEVPTGRPACGNLRGQPCRPG